MVVVEEVAYQRFFRVTTKLRFHTIHRSPEKVVKLNKLDYSFINYQVSLHQAT